MTWILSETLAPPSTATKGRSGACEGHAQVAQLLLHQQAGHARASRGAATPSVEAWARCAVPKASFTKTVAPLSAIELRGEGRVVRLLLRVEAQVLEQQHAAVRAAPPASLCTSAPDAVGRHARPARPAARASRAATGFRLNSGVGPLLGPAQVRGQDQPRARPSRRCSSVGSEARMRVSSVIGAVLERDVVVDAHEDALAREVLEVADGLLRPSAPATSARGRCFGHEVEQVASRGWRSPTRCRTRRRPWPGCRPPPW